MPRTLAAQLDELVIGGCKKGLKMAVCMEKCILFYWCWSRRLICSTLEPTFFILLKQTAASFFLRKILFFIKWVKIVKFSSKEEGPHWGLAEHLGACGLSNR